MKNTVNFKNTSFVLLFTLFILAMCVACKKKIVIDDLRVDKAILTEEKLQLIDTSVFKKRELIKLETNNQCLIGSISRIFEFENRIYIFDKKRQRVFIFDNTGKFISSIYHMGQGPGEYTQITDICLDKYNKQIVFLCSIPTKLIYYDLSGNQIKEQELDKTFSQMSIDKNYIYFLRFSKTNNKENDYLVYLVDKKTYIEKPIMSTNHEISQLRVGGNEIVSGENIIYTRRYDNHIYRLKDGQISSIFKVDFGEYNLPGSFLNENLSSREFQNQANQYAYTMVNCFETNKFLIFRTNQPFIYLLFKDSKIIKQYYACMDSQFDFGTSNYLPIENSTNKIALIYNSIYFDNYKKIMKEKNIQIQNTDLINITNEINSDSNPVLLIYTFK
jgi:hypothetical protein